MTLFVLICVLMLLAAMTLIGYPLLKRRDNEPSSHRVPVFILASLTMSLLAGSIYIGKTNWSWKENVSSDAGVQPSQEQAQLMAELKALQAKADGEPANVENWKALGRAYVGAGAFPMGVEAYQKAYDLTQGKDVEVLTGLAEALVLSDQTSMNGRVSVLIEQALQLQPRNPKALWYGGLVALQLDNLPLARERFKTMLAMDPPPQIRSLLERQIQDLDQQLGEAGKPAVASNARKIMVKVSVSPVLQQQLKAPMSLFVLARNPAQPGPPLAVERHQSSELPLQVELSTDDAMLPSRTLASADTVQVVARLSSSGTPTQQSGDLFGTVDYSFTKQGEQGSVNIEINQRVP